MRFETTVAAEKYKILNDKFWKILERGMENQDEFSVLLKEREEANKELVRLIEGEFNGPSEEDGTENLSDEEIANPNINNERFGINNESEIDGNEPNDIRCRNCGLASCECDYDPRGDPV